MKYECYSCDNVFSSKSIKNMILECPKCKSTSVAKVQSKTATATKTKVKSKLTKKAKTLLTESANKYLRNFILINVALFFIMMSLGSAGNSGATGYSILALLWILIIPYYQIYGIIKLSIYQAGKTGNQAAAHIVNHVGGTDDVVLWAARSLGFAYLMLFGVAIAFVLTIIYGIILFGTYPNLF